MGNTSIKKNKYKLLKNKKDYKINNNKLNDKNNKKINVSYDLINLSDSDSSDDSNVNSSYTYNHEVTCLLGDNHHNNHANKFISNVNSPQKINIINLQYISLWLNVYDNNMNYISNILIYDFNACFLQNKHVPSPSNNIFNVVVDHNINNFLYTLILYYSHQYNLKTKINEKSNIKNVIIFIQELIMIFLDGYEISIGMIGPINPSEIFITNDQLYKKVGIYDVHNDGIFSSKNDLIFNTNIKTIFNTSMILSNHFKSLNIGTIHKPTKTYPEIINLSLSLFYRFVNIYSIIQ